MLQPNTSNTRKVVQSEQFVQSALDALSAHIAILDETGKIIGVNSAWRRFADENHLRNANYGIGTNYLRVCDESAGRHSREASIIGTAIREIITNLRDEFYIEYPCHSKTEKRWFIAHVTRFEWEGSPRLIVAHQNVTMLKRVQIELDESRKRIETILNNVANGIVSISARGRLESVNPAAAEIFGYAPGMMLGEQVNMLFAEPLRSMTHRKLMQALQSENNYELVGQRRDGSQFPMFFIVNEIYLGNRHLFTGIIHDITERKRMEEELMEHQRLTLALDKERELRDFKTRFINLMSHELRTPLSSILLSSDLLKLYGEKADADERLFYLENIRTQVDYLTSLVREMVSVSNSDVSQTNFSPQVTDLVILCQQIIDEYRMMHTGTHRVIFVSNVSHVRSLVDIKLMRQILTNLLSNAIKYSPAGSDVKMAVERLNGSVHIHVQDNGIGIPAEDIPLLFEPFHRGGNVANLPGTGLGLTIVKQSIELHNGEITVNSIPDQGTTFTLTLPYVKES